MRNKLILLLILVLLFAGFVVARYFVLKQQNAYGKMRVLSSPVASVFINNIAIGKTPYENKYKPGEYLLKLIPEGDATDTASWQGKVKVYHNALSYINRELGSSDITSAGEIVTVNKMDKKPAKPDTGEVSVETEPNGAIVYLDNEEKGVAPVMTSDVQRGDHELSVFMPGFFRRNQKINVDTGFRVDALFKLAVDQSQQKATETEKKSEASSSAAIKKSQVTIKDTPTGWLRVREEASISASEAARVNPGEKYSLLDEKEGWYKIEYEKDSEGWISSQYASKD